MSMQGKNASAEKCDFRLLVAVRFSEFGQNTLIVR